MVSTSTGLLTFSRQPFDRDSGWNCEVNKHPGRYTSLDSAGEGEEGEDDILLSVARRLTVFVAGQ